MDWQISAKIARDGVARIDKFYLLSADRKRREAASETVEQLDTSSLPNFGKLIKATVPAGSELAVSRESLQRVGTLSAARAAAPVSALAWVALAAHPDTAPAALNEIARQTADPVAQAMASEQQGRAGLELLAEENPDFGKQALAQSNRVVQRALLGKLSGKSAGLLHDWSEDARVPLKPGLERLRKGTNLLSMTADTLRAMKPEDRSCADFAAALPDNWKALQERLPGGEALLAVVEIAATAETDDLAARLRLGDRLGAEEELVPELRSLLREAADPEQVKALDAWGKLARKLRMDDAVLAQGERDLLESGDSPEQTAIPFAATKPEQAKRLLRELNQAGDPGRQAYVGSLETFVSEDSEHLLRLALDPPETLHEAARSIESYDYEKQRQAVSAWGPLAKDQNDHRMLALIGSCRSEGVLAEALSGLGQEGVTPLTVAAAQDSDFAQAVADVHSFLPPEWADLATRLAPQASEGEEREEAMRALLVQATATSQANSEARLTLVNDVCDRIEPTPALADHLFVMLRDGCSGVERQRLDEWATLSRKLKMSGPDLLSGARRLLSEPDVPPAACAAEQIGQSDKPESWRALLEDGLTGAQARGDLREIAYLTALLGAADACSTLSEHHEVLRGAMELVRQGDGTKSLPVFMRHVDSLSQHDLSDGRAVIAGALAGASPLAEDEVQRAQLELVQFAAGRDAQDPRGAYEGVAGAVRALADESEWYGDPVAALGYQLYSSSGSSPDRLAIQEQVLTQLQRSPDPNTKATANFLARLDGALAGEGDQAREEVLGAALRVLSNESLTGVTLAASLDWPSHRAQLHGAEQAGSELMGSREPGKRAAGTFLNGLSRLSFSSIESQARATATVLSMVEDSSSDTPQQLLAAMGHQAQRCCSFGQEYQQVAEGCLAALGEAALNGRDQTGAGLYSLMARLAATPVKSEEDRRTIGSYSLAYLGDQETVRVEQLTEMLRNCTSDLSEGGLAVMAQTLLTALDGAGDPKLLSPLAAKYRSQLETAGDVHQARESLGALYDDLDRYCQGDFWTILAPSAPGAIEERPDALIVGGVRLPKQG